MITIPVQAPQGCAWEAATPHGFIQLSGGGTGDGELRISVAANEGPIRSGTVTIGELTIEVSQDPAISLPPGCSFALSATSLAAPATAGTISVTVTAPAGCFWSASTSGNFLSLVERGDYWNGSRVVAIQVALNAGPARTGSVRIAGQVVSITQESGQNPSCSYVVTPASVSLTTARTTVVVTVTTSSECAWALSKVSGPTFFSYSINAVAGSGTANIQVNQNFDTSQRSATFSVGGTLVTITQAAAPTPCTYTSTPGSTTVPATGGTVTVSIAAPAGCSWATSLVTGQQFLTITSGAGVGNGVVTVNVPANLTFERQGLIKLSGSPLLIGINQVAGPNCAQHVPRIVHFLDHTGGTKTFNVTAQPSCHWTVAGAGGFLTLTAGGSGTDDGTFSYSVAPNTSGASRQATLTFGGASIVVRQSAAPPAAGSFFSYRSPEGEYVGAGFSHTFTVADGIWAVQNDPGHPANELVYVHLEESPSLDFSWTIALQGPNRTLPTPGTYVISDFKRWPFQEPAQPGMDVSGQGHGCNRVTGQFVVTEAVYGSGGTVERFHATFEQRCEQPTRPALTGEIRIVGNPPQ